MLVLTISRVEPNKNPSDFIKIAKLVNQKINAKFIWVGEGSLLEFCKRKTEKLDFIQFIGLVSEDIKEELLSKCDVYISTSTVEGFGVTLGEAFIHEKPVIAYQLPVFKEIYLDYPIYIEIKRVNEFARKIIEVLRNRDYYVNRAREAKRFILSNYSIDRVVSRVEMALQDVIKG